jgi:hypothetical protein
MSGPPDPAQEAPAAKRREREIDFPAPVEAAGQDVLSAE